MRKAKSKSDLLLPQAGREPVTLVVKGARKIVRAKTSCSTQLAVARRSLDGTQLTNPGKLAVAVRRNLTNVSSAGFQFAAMEPISGQTVSRAELFTQAAAHVHSCSFYVGVRHVLRMPVPPKFKPLV